MSPYTIDEEIQPARFAFQDACVVEDAQATHAALAQALAAHDILAIDLSAIHYADITFVQLLLAALLAAREQGKRLELVGGASESVLQALRLSGIECQDLIKDFFNAASQQVCVPRDLR